MRLDKLTTKFQMALADAQSLAIGGDQQFIEAQHLLLALIDDIATVLDDVALLSKVAAKKTAGVLGDDLALNAQQVSGVNPDRELPVVWAVAVGSFKNKAILVPLALLVIRDRPASVGLEAYGSATASAAVRVLAHVATASCSSRTAPSTVSKHRTSSPTTSPSPSTPPFRAGRPWALHVGRWR